MIAAAPKQTTEQKLLDQFWRDCRPTRLRELAVWAEDELKLPSGPAAGRRYKLDRLPYARLLFAELGKWRRHVITGPTQGGKTFHGFVAVICYYLFEVKVDVIVGIPDLNMAGVKWSKDIRPVIEASSYRGMIPTRGPGSKGGNPTDITFLNGQSLLFMAGGGNDKQRAGATAPVLIVTETDALDVISQTSQEGQSKIDQLEGRVNAFDLDARIFAECTVSTEGAYTWKKYKAGTESRIACQCESCGDWVTPEREHFVGWDTANDEIEAGEKAAFSCPSCGILYSDEQRRQMNLGAKSVHRGQEITPEGEVVGEPPKTDTLGFRWSAFNNLLVSSRLLGMKEWSAAQSEDPAAEITVKQQLWALPAEDEQVEKVPISIGIVRGSANGYHGRCNGRPMWDVPEWAECITAHADVGSRVINWSVNAHGPNRIRDVIAYGATETEQPDVVGKEEAVAAALPEVRHIIESNCDPDLVLVDCGHQFNEKKKDPRRVVYEFILSAGPNWRAAMGLSSFVTKERNAKVKPSPNGDPWYESRQKYGRQFVKVIDFDPNHFKHLSHGGYLIRPSTGDGQRAAGSVTMFGTDPSEHKIYARQVNAEQFQFDHKTGKAKWQKVARDNHYFDNDVGNLVARSIVQSGFLVCKTFHLPGR